jgi:hypothetical protein
MINNYHAVDIIERAQGDTPFCTCGAPTTPVWRPDGMWLECSAVQARADHGRMRRMLATIASPVHIRQLLFDEDALAA